MAEPKKEKEQNSETVYQTLSRIQKTLKVPKGQMNAFGGYKFRNAEDILESVKPLLGECIVTLSDSLIQVGDRFYLKSTATLSLGEEGISVDGWAREAQEKKGMDQAQITGAASSYARKYALGGLFCIDDTKDADTTNTGEDVKADRYVEPKPSKAQETFMQELEPTDEEIIVQQERLESAKNTKELKEIWSTVPPMVQMKLAKLKDELKFKLT